MSIYDVEIAGLDGRPLRLEEFKGREMLIVNVASRCGLTPQYQGLEQLQKDFSGRGFTVLGVPCNQFGAQEPGSADEIRRFCSTTYGVTFPMTEKIDVNGPARHPLYRRLTDVPDDTGEAGDVQWNFEKFLVAPGGKVVGRFRPQVAPGSPEVMEAIETNLPE